MHKRIFRRRMNVLLENEQKMIDEYGWYAHLVPAEDGLHANYHTHGVSQSFHHLDFQITLNVDPNLAHRLFVEAVENVKHGMTFKDGERSPLIIKNFDVLFREFTEEGRTVLRILLPDPSGILPTMGDCNKTYVSQLDETVE